MKKQRYKALLIFVLLGAALTGPSLADSIPAPDGPRAKALIYLLEQDCGSCHGSTLKGGLGPSLLPDSLVAKEDEILVDTILYGRPGTPMPPWEFEINENEARWLVQILKEGLK